MTESDLRDARDALGERLDSQRPPRRRAAIIAVAAAAAVIPVLGFIAFQTIGEDDKTAPPPADPAPTVSTRTRTSSPGRTDARARRGGLARGQRQVVIRFAAPGLVSIDDAGRLFHSPTPGVVRDRGRPDHRDRGGGPAGCDGQEVAMRASLPRAWGDAVREHRGRTASARRCGTGGGASSRCCRPTARWLSSSSPGSTVRTREEASALEGVWMAEGGGYVLEIDPDGSYYVVGRLSSSRSTRASGPCRARTSP